MPPLGVALVSSTARIAQRFRPARRGGNGRVHGKVDAAAGPTRREPSRRVEKLEFRPESRYHLRGVLNGDNIRVARQDQENLDLTLKPQVH